MTAEVHIPAVVPPRVGERASPTTEDVSTRMLGTARRLVRDGFALLAIAAILGIAETIALWFGAVIVAIGLLSVGVLLAVAALVWKVGVRQRR